MIPLKFVMLFQAQGLDVKGIFDTIFNVQINILEPYIFNIQFRKKMETIMIF